jgi:hypothetical protein
MIISARQVRGYFACMAGIHTARQNNDVQWMRRNRKEALSNPTEPPSHDQSAQGQ